jgi:GT2 family glycosyltransferase
MPASGLLPSGPRVTVSVVSHGQRELVAALLEQLTALCEPDIARVVVVHNLPDADLPKPPGGAFELVQLHNPKPLGFSANHNLAFGRCVTPWFAVLNPDLEFRFGNPFPALLEAAADPRLGAVAPILVQPGTLHVEPPRGVVTPMELVRRRLPGWKPPAEPAWLVGAFLFIRAEAFRALGGFDERFRLYCEDVDLGLRLRESGWRILRIESAKVLHQTQRHSHTSWNYTLLHISSLLRLWGKFALRANLHGTRQ